MNDSEAVKGWKTTVSSQVMAELSGGFPIWNNFGLWEYSSRVE